MRSAWRQFVFTVYRSAHAALCLSSLLWISTGVSCAVAEEVSRRDTKTHWSLVPLAQFQEDVCVDQFVDARLDASGLSRNPPADRATLIRRLFLDMHGLPPTPEQTAAFLADEEPKAYAQLVDHVLQSPRYGERWAQHWLDVVRYADTDGFEVNTPRENAWPYRDYVIAAFNDDKPYDQFIREQLAGDAYDADAATGFLVAAPALLPGQIGQDDVSKRLARQDALDEIVVGTSATFLGLTVGCARCHDHKFDAITQRDYYATQAFFAGVEYGEREIDDARRRENLARAAELAPELKQLEGECASLRPLSIAGWSYSLDKGDAERFTATAKRLGEIFKEKTRLETPRRVFAGQFREPDTTRFLLRGDPEQPTERVAPQWISMLGERAFADDMTDQARRVVLAEWIASPANPLTARVMANRIWQWHFGVGIVETPNDFGVSGAPPTHPALLDWLAGELIDSGWSVKHVHRLILRSATYQQTSHVDPLAKSRDADCRLLSRFPSRRLEAEAIRDSMLQVAGNLNLEMGGPGFDFFTTRGGLSGFPPLDELGPNEMRRMIYAHKIRMERTPVFGAFDCPDGAVSMPMRSQSTTAIQALNLFNSQFVLDQSAAFAERLRASAGESTEARIDAAFEFAFCRRPTDAERRACVDVAREHGLETVCRALFNSNEFLFLP